MKLATDNTAPGKLKEIGAHLTTIIERGEKDHYEMGEELCAADAIAASVELSAVEGIEGKTPKIRFGKMFTNGIIPFIKPNKRKMCMDLYLNFGHRRGLVDNWKVSPLNELLRNSACNSFMEDVIAENPQGMGVDEVKAEIARRLAPANEEEETEETKETAEKLPEWPDVLALVSLDTEALDTARQDHMHPQFMLARALQARQKLVIKELAPLSKAERRTAMAAVVRILENEQDVFATELKTAVPKYYQVARSKLETELKKQREITKKLRTGKVSINELGMQVMLKSDFKRFVQALHPDKFPDDKAKTKYGKLCADFQKYAEDYGE